MNSSHKVLVIEDVSALRQALAKKLSREGFAVLEAGDGLEGLEMALQHQPDLLLLDILMPKMDGLTVYKKLQQDSWGITVPVIILTNLVDEDYINDSLETGSGSYEYLVKSDWKLEDIVKKVREKLGIKA